jgi:hypothetical protein
MLVRWTIGGNVKPAGFTCLKLSVMNFQLLYPRAILYICYNGLHESQVSQLQDLPASLINQEYTRFVGETPIGVAWKLRPPRLSIAEYEVFIDNDLILRERLDEIDRWVNTGSTLVLESESRHYGTFARHIPNQYRINSGLFGVPPGFNLESYIALWGRWSNNCPNASYTWCEQGLVASALTHSTNHILIPQTTVTNCEVELIEAPGMHFISLNRVNFHRPFAEYMFNHHRKPHL